MKKFHLLPILIAMMLSGCGTPKKPVQPDDSQNPPSEQPEDKDVAVSSISINPSSLTLLEGEVSKLSATVLPENATYEKIYWSSSDETIASVDGDGTVRAGTVGQATITAKAGDKTATCVVTIEQKPNVDPEDYISNVKLSEHSDFETYEDKTFVKDKISRVTLDYVEDGDTVHFNEGDNKLSLRMVFIDTPEDTEAWGSEATNFVKAIMLQAKTIVITNILLSTSEPVVLDSTGERYLGFIWYSNKENAALNELRCLNLEIVYEGYSKSRSGTGYELSSYFAYCQSDAQQNKRRIWENYVAPENDFGYNHYDGYYGELTWENGEDLKEKLHDIIAKDVQYHDYIWEVNQLVDHSLYDLEMLDVVYSDTDVYYSKTQTYWQREHVFPASLMTGKPTGDAVKTKGRATDFHNLFAGESSGNSSRGNKNYGMATTDNGTITDRGVSSGGYAFDPKNFEPGEKDKGRLARSILYMDVMYSESENPSYQPLSIVDEYVTYSAENCQFAIGNKFDLISWANYSVDKLEYQHNELVYSTEINGVKQNNRNPFVDYPGLVDYIYGTKKDVPGDLKNVCPRALDLDLENEGIQYYAIKKAKREAQVGQTYTKNDFTLVGIDNKFQEVEVSQDVTTFSSVTFNQVGTKRVEISTNKNTIYLDVDVKQSEVEYSYLYEFSGNVTDDFGTNHIGSDGNGDTINATLAGKAWTVTADHETDMRKGANGIGAQFGFGTATRPGVLTLETVNQCIDVDSIKLVANTNANQSMNVKIYVGSNLISDYNLTGNSKESYEKIVELSETKSGNVKIVLTPAGNYSVVVKTIAINEVR